MPVLTINREKPVEIIFQPGQSISEILDGTEFRVRTGCSGTGACGLCRVRIEEGRAGEPTPTEMIHLDQAALASGIRLACQLTPTEDMRIEIINPAPHSPWKKPYVHVHKRYPGTASEILPDAVTLPKGVAVDLGTTFINISLWDLANGKYLTGRYGVNPQTAYGADVITRLVAAVESNDKGIALRRQIVDGVADGLQDIAAREGINPGDVVRVVLVGNTAMLSLFTGYNPGFLLHPKNWTAPMEGLTDAPGILPADLSVHPEAVIEIISPLAGFVGSDLLVGVLATALTEKGQGGLLIDFGTNSEIALWDGTTLWITSAAGGPAFEGSGIGCGMPAERGAIRRVSVVDDTLRFDIVGGREPTGLCGSGLVDLLAILVRSRQLDPTGRFSDQKSHDSLMINMGDPPIVLSKRDVDVLQRAKAAIAAGVKTLMNLAGMKSEQLSRMCIGGAFGQCLDVENAREIGLLPDIEAEVVELCGNTALAGCEELLLAADARSRLSRLRSSARVINLSACQDYDDLYFDNLYLRPMSLDSSRSMKSQPASRKEIVTDPQPRQTILKG